MENAVPWRLQSSFTRSVQSLSELPVGATVSYSDARHSVTAMHTSIGVNVPVVVCVVVGLVLVGVVVAVVVAVVVVGVVVGVVVWLVVVGVVVAVVVGVGGPWYDTVVVLDVVVVVCVALVCVAVVIVSVVCVVKVDVVTGPDTHMQLLRDSHAPREKKKSHEIVGAGVVGT